MPDKIYVGDNELSSAYVGDMNVYAEAFEGPYKVTINHSFCTVTDVQYIYRNTSAQITITPDEGYFIRKLDVIVDGADYAFAIQNDNYIVTISNAYKDVTVNINCIELYLRFHCDEEFTFSTTSNLQFTGTLEYSTNKIDWTQLTSKTSTTIGTGTDFYLRGISNNYVNSVNTSSSAISPFSFSKQISLYGSIDSLLDYQTVKKGRSFGIYHKEAFVCLFINSKVKSAENLIMSENIQDHNNSYYKLFSRCTELVIPPKLPSTTVRGYESFSTTIRRYGCYAYMFEYCTSLATAPELPALEMRKQCYMYMFYNCTSLVNAPELPATTLEENCYDSMFKGCSSLTTALKLPTISLDYTYCYQEMFYGCTSLVNPPELPATTLAHYCYKGMFNGCTSLVNAPELPATTLKSYCYERMFNGCTSLVNAPELPATTLEYECYEGMFEGCTSLVNAPELPATTATTYCYSFMFSNCTSLVNAPELPATTLADSCYREMFSNCTSLIEAPALNATTLINGCYMGMFSNCTALINPPQLPSVKTQIACYYNMFMNCINLEKIPNLPATTLTNNCYNSMFKGCTKIKLSTYNDGSVYINEYKIPSSGEVSSSTSNSLTNMFQGTGGTFTGTPVINTTYYTSNTIV